MPAQAGIHYCLVPANETGSPQGFAVDIRANLDGPRLGGRGDGLEVMPAQAGIHYRLVPANETGSPQGFAVDIRANLNGPRLGGRGPSKLARISTAKPCGLPVSFAGTRR